MLQSSVIFLVSSTLLHILLLFATQSYSGTHSRGETALPTRNELLLCISLSAISSWFSPTDRILFLCPGYINCNKEDMKIMTSVTKDYDNQSSDVLLSIWECDNVDRRGANGNKELWYCGFYGNEYNIWNSKKALMHLTRSGGHSISQCRGDIIPK